MPTTQQQQRTPSGHIKFSQTTPSARAPQPADWPFWKVVPRFVRESTTADFLDAITALYSSENPRTRIGNYLAGACLSDYSRSGRESLYMILKSLGLPRGSRVGVPLYCCDAVFMAIRTAEFVPVFLDIDLNTYSVDEESLWRRRKQIDALILVHTFGYPANISRIQELLSATEIPVIEDCAHSLFSDFMGVPTGLWTQASFFTFGSHKPAAAGGGGMAVINNPEIASRFRFVAGHRASSSKMSELRHAAATWFRGVCYARALYGALLASTSANRRDERINETEYREVHRSDFALKMHSMRRVDAALLERSVTKFQRSLPLLAAHAAQIRHAVADTTMKTPDEPSYGSWNHYLGACALRERIAPRARPRVSTQQKNRHRAALSKLRPKRRSVWIPRRLSQFRNCLANALHDSEPRLVVRRRNAARLRRSSSELLKLIRVAKAR